MHKMQTRGFLICFEGMDRAGKSTQAGRLKDYLNGMKNGRSTSIIRFPGRFINFSVANGFLNYKERSTAIGKIIDGYLQGSLKLADEVVHMLFSTNRWERREHIISELKKGNNVILDRYVYSGVTYSASKGMDFEWCKNGDKGLPKPDIVFYISLSEKEIESREGFGKEIYEKVEMQKKVREFYEKMKEDSWAVIDGKKSIDDVTKEVLEKFDQYNAKGCSEDIGVF